jgi:hypothetical protein
MVLWAVCHSKPGEDSIRLAVVGTTTRLALLLATREFLLKSDK